MSEHIEKAIGVIFVVIGVVIGITAMMNQAPTVANSVSTSTGTALANAGITGNTLAGQVYSFVPVLYALAPLLLIVGGFLTKRAGLW